MTPPGGPPDFHQDVEVTDGLEDSRPRVSQVFCSALPVAYRSEIAVPHWEALARLVLEAAYEATILCGILNAAHAKSNRVLLTALGGGAFEMTSDGFAMQWCEPCKLRNNVISTFV